MITVRNAEVKLTEQTVKELMRAIEQAKEEVEFTRDPIPDSDMSREQYIEEQKKRGFIRVKSSYSNIEFFISIQGGANENQESLGYKLL
jgi:hypothetical protein